MNLRVETRAYHDCWPRPMIAGPGETLERAVSAYRMGIEIFLGSDFLPNYPLTETAFEVFDQLAPKLFGVGRWKNYQVPEMGDMNVASHDLRQAGITSQALYFDAEALEIGFPEKDAMIAAALLHDLGELAVGDVTYDLKQGSQRENQIKEAQAVMVQLDSFENLKPNRCQKLKEIYLRIATSLEEDDILKLLGGQTTAFIEKINWLNLRDLFKLYERYSYLITAIEQYPLKTDGFSDADMKNLEAWNRPELETALAQGKEIPKKLRGFILFKNVILNQWPHLLEASKRNLSSVWLFFLRDPLARKTIRHADQLMNLNLDLSSLG